MTPTPQAIGAMLRKAREAASVEPGHVDRALAGTSMAGVAGAYEAGERESPTWALEHVARALGLELVVTMAIVDPVTGVTVAVA